MHRTCCTPIPPLGAILVRLLPNGASPVTRLRTFAYAASVFVGILASLEATPPLSTNPPPGPPAAVGSTTSGRIPTPLVSAQSDAGNGEVCEGATVTFSGAVSGAFGNPQYQWFHDGVKIPGATSMQFVLVAGPSSGGDYTFGVKAGVGTKPTAYTQSAAVHLSVIVLPAQVSVAASNSTPSTCLGVQFTLVANIAVGTPPFDYQWLKNGTPIVGETNSTITLPSLVQGVDDGLYDVEVRNACNQAPSLPVLAALPYSLVVADPPLNLAVQSIPANGIACVGDTLHFTSSVAGTAPFTYQWRKDGVAIQGATGSTFDFATTSVNDSGAYDVVVTNGCNFAQSTPIAISVLAPPDITADPVTTAACVSGLGSATFTVAASGSAPFTYQWRKDGNVLPAATNSSLTISPVTSNDGGLYDCVVSNACGTVTSNAASLALIDFLPAVHYAVGNAPNDVIAADLSIPPDGLLDLATADSGSARVTIRRNNGAGSFNAVQNVSLFNGDVPAALAAGNFIAGGPTDLFVVCSTPGLIRVLNGATNFTQNKILLMPNNSTNPIGIAAGNFNGNAITDVVVAVSGDLLLGGGSVAVSLDTNPLVALPAPQGGFQRVFAVACGDLDHDGDVDVVATVAPSGFAPSTTDNVLLYANAGNGSFTFAGSLSVDANPRAVRIGDVNGDGHNEIVVTMESGVFAAPGGVILFQRDSNPGLSPSNYTLVGPFTAGQVPHALALGDLGADSPIGGPVKQDVVSVNFASSDLGVFAQFGASSFVGGTATYVAQVNPSVAAIGDFDSDGMPDIAVANRSSNTVSVLRSVSNAKSLASSLPCEGAPLLGVAFDGAQRELLRVRAVAPSPSRAWIGIGTEFAGRDAVGAAGCPLLLSGLVSIAPVALARDGSFELSAVLPANTLFEGRDFYVQAFVHDEATNLFAGSNALRIDIGR